ncbi:class I SAM-dependent methyltransferase [Candidatus Omnitrophota bacterium]
MPIHCIDCGNENVQTAYIRSPKDSNITLPADKSIPPADSYYVIVRCNNCESIFLHPYYFNELPLIYDEDRYYAGYFPGNIHTGGNPSLGSSRFFLLKRYLNKRKAHFFMKLAGISQRSAIRVLDFGCSQGDLVQGFIDCGCDAVGVDISKKASLEAQKRGVHIYHGHLENVPFPDNSFDIIVSIETIEHIPYLDAVCNKIRHLLKERGMLIIKVPNDVDGYRRTFFKKIWWMIPPVHVRFFTIRNIANIFGRYGFRIVAVRTSGLFGCDIADIIRWFLEKTRIRKLQNSIFWWLCGKAICILFLPVDFVLNALGKHSEIIVAMRKDSGS